MTQSQTINYTEIKVEPNKRPVYGLTFDGSSLWAAQGNQLVSIDPQTGQTTRTLACECDAGIAFDGKYLWKLCGEAIHQVDPQTGDVLKTLVAPGKGSSNSGLAWAENSLWVGQFNEKRIYQISTEDGSILKTINSNRFVTGVTWYDNSLWYGTWEDEQSELRKLDIDTGEIKESYNIESGKIVTGLTHDNNELYCGGGDSGCIRKVSTGTSV